MVAKSRAASLDERIMGVARNLAQQKPLDHIGLSEIARLSGVSWPTVKRHVGSKEALRLRLVREQPDLVRSVRDTKSRLLDAAARVFAHRGYEAATLDEVAKVAGLTKGAVYWHFESKADLFRALLQEFDRRQAEFDQQRSQAFRDSRDAEQALAELLAAELQRAREVPDWARLRAEFVSESREDGVRRQFADGLTRRRQELSELVQELQQNGKINSGLDPNAIALVWTATIRGFLETWLVEPELDLEAAAAVAAHLIASSLPQVAPASVRRTSLTR
jgi:AcrR family transcriptional regulator